MMARVWTEDDLAALKARQERRAMAPIKEAPPVPLEAEVLPAVLDVLRWHPAVAWVERMNRGGFVNPSGQYVNFGFEGMSDLTGQMRDGRRLEVEVKRPGRKPTNEQRKYLERVRAAGGVAFYATSVDDVIREMRAQAPL